MEVKLTYFKKYGKYYTEGTFQMKDVPMFTVCDAVRVMDKEKVLPGLNSGQWLREGHIYVYTDSDQFAVPCLILSGSKG